MTTNDRRLLLRRALASRPAERRKLLSALSRGAMRSLINTALNTARVPPDGAPRTAVLKALQVAIISNHGLMAALQSDPHFDMRSFMNDFGEPVALWKARNDFNSDRYEDLTAALWPAVQRAVSGWTPPPDAGAPPDPRDFSKAYMLVQQANAGLRDIIDRLYKGSSRDVEGDIAQAPMNAKILVGVLSDLSNRH